MTATEIHPAASEPDPATGAVLRRDVLREIDPRTLYLLLQLRERVFTFEQGADEEDLDARELEPTTTLLWVEVPADPQEIGGLERRPVATIRLMQEPSGSMRIGRLVVAKEHRRDGYGGRLMRAALDVAHELAPEEPVDIDAQAYLEQWYLGMGYVTTGEVFLEAGIEHVPMRYEHPRED